MVIPMHDRDGENFTSIIKPLTEIPYTYLYSEISILTITYVCVKYIYIYKTHDIFMYLYIVK